MSPKIEQSNGITPIAPNSKHSKKVFFTYPPGETSFQLGCLGADKSTIEGVLHLRYTDNKPIFVKKIRLSFVGKEYVFFAGTLSKNEKIVEDNESEFYEEEEEVSTTTISKHTAKRKIFNKSTIIWSSQSKGHYEGIKDLDLPFKFKLPDNLPPSIIMDKGCGRIYYMLKAVISRKPIDPNSNNKKKMIKVVVPIFRYTITPQPEPSRWFIKNEGPAKPHAIGYDMSLTQSVFGPGASIVIPLKLFFYEPQVYLKKIFVGLKEYHELRTNKYETLIKGYVVEETIKDDDIPISSKSDNEISVEVKLNIPSARQLGFSVNSTFLSAFHKLKVKIHLGRAPDISLSKLVKIENIITENEIIPPRPSAVDILREITHKPIKKHKLESLCKRLSPFLPLFNTIQNSDSAMKRKISLQLRFHITDSKNPELIYNSRSLIIPITSLNPQNSITS